MIIKTGQPLEFGNEGVQITKGLEGIALSMPGGGCRGRRCLAYRSGAGGRDARSTRQPRRLCYDSLR